MRVVERHVQFPIRSHQLIPVQLIMLLMVVVVLVIIETCFSLCVIIESTRIVATTIERLLIFRCVVPSHVGFLRTVEGDELHAGVVVEIARLQEIGVEARCGTVDVSITSNVRQSSLQTEMMVNQSCAEAQRFLVGTIRTYRGAEVHVWFCIDVLRQHVHRGTECTCTIGRGTDTTLNLHRLQAAGEVTHVGEIDERTLAVVEWHTVGGDVDARWIHTSDAQTCVADAGTCVGCCCHTGCERNEERNVLAMVLLVDVLTTDVRESHRCFARGTQ